MLRTLPVLAALVIGTAHAAGPVAINESLTAFNAHATFPVPLLDDKQLESLSKGEVVRIIQRDANPDLPARALAFKLSDHAMEPLWVAMLDPHLTVDPDLTEEMLSTKDGRELWYGYYKLPYPISDRHWTIESWNSHGLARATGGKAWEHPWKLVPHRLGEAQVAVAEGRVAGLTTESIAGAVYTPDNHGAWVLLDVGGGKRVIGYHATSTIGGSIPDWIALRLVHGRLEALLERIDERCNGTVAEHYTSTHKHLQAGDGSALTWRP